MPLDSLETELSVGDSTAPTRHSENLSDRWLAVLMIWHLVGGSQRFEIFQDIKELIYILNDFQKSDWVFQHPENLSALS